MSEDEREIDIESDEDEDEEYESRARQSHSTQFYSQAEKRAHHNALERKRRDHIKDSFSSLRDAVLLLKNEKVASRAQILKKAAEYIITMRRKNHTQLSEIEDLKRQNNLLEAQIATLEAAKGKQGCSDNNFKIEEESGGEIYEEEEEDEEEEESSSESADEAESDEAYENYQSPKRIKTELQYG